jgi:hypothetical protein
LSAPLHAQQPGTITTVAGGDEGPELPAGRLVGPWSSLAVDPSGNVYVSRRGRDGHRPNSTIEKIAPDGTHTHFAGSRDAMTGLTEDTKVAGQPAKSVFIQPFDLAADGQGNVYFINGEFTVTPGIDYGRQILEVDQKGFLAVVSPASIFVSILATNPTGDMYILYESSLLEKRVGEGPPETLIFKWPDSSIYPKTIAIDASGNFYFLADDSGKTKVYKASNDGKVDQFYPPSGASSGLGFLSDLTVDSNGIIYVVQSPSNAPSTLYRLDSAANAVPVALPDLPDPIHPELIAADGKSNLYLTDDVGRVIRIAPDGSYFVMAGGNPRPFPWDGLPARGAALKGMENPLFYHPTTDVLADPQGGFYITSRNRILKVDAQGIITAVADAAGTAGFSGDGGPAKDARLDMPYGLALDRSGNLYFADVNNHRVRKIDSSGTITTVMGPDAVFYFNPIAVTADAQGNLFVADSGRLKPVTVNNQIGITTGRVYKRSPDGAVTVAAGSGDPINFGSITPGKGDGLPATQAPLTFPTDVAIDTQGNLLIVEGEYSTGIVAPEGPHVPIYCQDFGPGTDTIRRVGPDGIIHTVSHVPKIRSIAPDARGNLFVTTGERVIREITPTLSINLIAGRPIIEDYRTCGLIGRRSTGDGGPATDAMMQVPTGVAVDPQGNLLIAEGNRIRQVFKVAAPGLTAGLQVPPPAPGDLDSDGRLTILDVILSLRLALQLQPPTLTQQLIADVNHDGVLNLLDAILILQVAAGQRPDLLPHLPQSDDFSAGLKPFWKARQPQEDFALPQPSYEVSSGTLSLTSADRDVWLDIWEPFAVYQDQLYGDFTMQLKVEQVPACHEVSAAGLLLAQALPEQITDPSQIPTWALLQATHADGPEAKWGGGGTSTSSLNIKGIRADLKPPYWVRVDRQGSVISFFVSTDGAKSWERVTDPVDLAAAGYPLKDPVVAGIEEQTHCDTTLGTAGVSHFEAGPLSQAGQLPGD